MKSTRREVLTFAGGSAVGLLFTPVPWRLIADTALWSENWPGIPAPPRGEIRTRYTNCALCPAGCAVRARCVVDQPVELAGVSGHPLSKGALCAFGIAGHHLPYIPGRVKEGPVKEAAAAVAQGIARCGAAECVAVLDLQPGRTASWTYRRAMAAVRNGKYVTGQADGAVAVDVAAARTVLSFGIPVLDGWGTPGNVNAARAGFRLIQVDAVETRTASMADRWLRVRPGSEEVLAEALAGRIPPAQAADATGLAEAEIAAAAQEVAQSPALLVLGNSNIESTGRTVLARRETPVPEDWRKAAPVDAVESLPDRSVRVLLIDESAAGEYLPWKSIERKLVADDAVVVAFAWNREGYGRHAGYVLPAAVYPEADGDIPPAIDSPVAAFRLSVPLVPAPAGMIKPEEFVAASAHLPIGDTLRERADAIRKAGRGSLFSSSDGKSAAVKDLKPDDFWKALQAGGVWLDGPDAKAPAAQLRVAKQELLPVEEADLPLVVVSSREFAPATPLCSKLYQESNLRLGPDCVALHPSCGLKEGAKAVFETVLGRRPVRVVLDAGVPAGLVHVTASPALVDLCAAGTRAKVERA